jgi:formyltetrahydrofolate-dependent phosphoribosylglycinamide formyltransferase
MSTAPLQLAVLISGSGTTLQNLIDQIRAKKLNAEIRLVIASREGIKGITRANDAGIRCQIIQRKQFASTIEFSQKIFAMCGESRAELICLAGWLSLLEIPPAWDGKVMNIHPALLPSFGGPGMYGPRVHQAVLNHGCKVSGCTVHFVNNDYDSGPIILQRCCPVMEDDTPDTLAHRVFEEEKIAYPQAIRLYQSGQLKVHGRQVRIANAEVKSSS